MIDLLLFPPPMVTPLTSSKLLTAKDERGGKKLKEARIDNFVLPQTKIHSNTRLMTKT